MDKIKTFLKWLLGIVGVLFFGAAYLRSKHNDDSSGIAGMGTNIERGKAAQRERERIERERESGLDNRAESIEKRSRAIGDRQEIISERERIEREREDLAGRKRKLLERIKSRHKK